MKRLIKQSVMDMATFENNLNQLSEKGRAILRSIEDYKFTLEQAARVMVNDQQLTQKLVQKRKSMEMAAGQVYSVVFDIENIDIVTAYERQVTPFMPSEKPDVPSPQKNTPPPNPNATQPPEQELKDEENTKEEASEEETEESESSEDEESEDEEE